MKSLIILSLLLGAVNSQGATSCVDFFTSGQSDAGLDLKELLDSSIMFSKIINKDTVVTASQSFNKEKSSHITGGSVYSVEVTKWKKQKGLFRKEKIVAFDDVGTYGTNTVITSKKGDFVLLLTTRFTGRDDFSVVDTQVYAVVISMKDGSVKEVSLNFNGVPAKMMKQIKSAEVSDDGSVKVIANVKDVNRIFTSN